VKKVSRNTVLGTDTVVIPLAYDAGGRLVSRASDTFAFDSDGNQVTAVENGDESRYFWSPDNRLVKVEKDIECPKHGKKKCRQCPQTQTFTVSESYAYLPNDWRRISRTADGQQYLSVYDGADESHEYQLKTRWDKDEDDDWRKCPDKDRNKPRLKLIRQFIGGPGTDDLELTRYHGRKLWTLKDGIGSTIALTNRGGNAVARIGYDAWGSFRWPDKPGHGVKPCREDELDGWLERFEGGRSFGFEIDGWLWGRHHAKSITPYLFASRRFDSFSNLYNNRERQYSPRLGRFITKDPIGFEAGNNLYIYVSNNLALSIDPFGLLIGPRSGFDPVTGSFYTSVWLLPYLHTNLTNAGWGVINRDDFYTWQIIFVPAPPLFCPPPSRIGTGSAVYAYGTVFIPLDLVNFPVTTEPSQRAESYRGLPGFGENLPPIP